MAKSLPTTRTESSEPRKDEAEEMKMKALRASWDLVNTRYKEADDIFKYLTLLHPKEMNKIIDEENQ